MPLKTSSMNALPDSIQTLAEVIGESAALTLVRAWPPTTSSTTGRHRVIVYVPSTLPDQHRLIDILGHDVAQRLVAHFGGELLFLASCFAAGAHERREQIARAVASGMPRDHVAREFGVSQTTIKRALRGARIALPPAVHPALLKGYARA
ncbi:TPA: helix-turn-helix domain-containing protein [Stenotrophomonas maltophilia]|nr:helix-turn-helix domain-containing protein [Stenotrophomonas maltophilia]HEL7888626.1 helix-turn-helix domain-containing protein [Stenotrophomonas maltophilia]HEL7892215.1 helix-turn-helix domain-containing protein [Stenotrophomonas maltophilia]